MIHVCTCVYMCEIQVCVCVCRGAGGCDGGEQGEAGEDVGGPGCLVMLLTAARGI
jgi:hypothetical protein